MRDIQDSVAAYYAATAEPRELGGEVRNFLTSAQRLNELLAKQIGDSSTYNKLLESSSCRGGELIGGVKYARNVVEHTLHIVRPKDDALVGGVQGFRVYPVWDEIPLEVHKKLRKGTQELRPAYGTAFQGREVTETMLSVLQFYAGVSPNLVHRDPRGEWTGFPLMNQPAMAARLHPEEPMEVEAAWHWLNGRIPNGDARVVCCQLASEGSNYLLGLTFIGRLSFAPFVESMAQVNCDVDAGFPYLVGDVSRNIEEVTERFPEAKQGAVFQSRNDVTCWASPIKQLNAEGDWRRFQTLEFWKRAMRTEGSGMPSFDPRFYYEVRRSRRLNALVPPHAQRRR